MRQGQQNRRGRGRGRKTQNPLSRNLESNGPDVKIRGTASHIAEKYAGLARDALSSGDTVMAENYYQHAEHYQRIIMAAQNQPQQGGTQPDANGAGNQQQQRNAEGNAHQQGGEAADQPDAATDQKQADNGTSESAETAAAGGNGAAAEDEKVESEASTDKVPSA